MKNYILTFFFIAITIACISFSDKKLFVDNQQLIQTANENATPSTRQLLTLLHTLKKNYTIIGHQDDLAYGNGWRYNNYNPKGYVSDTYNSGGEFPGVFGWDIGQIENTLTNPKVNYLINGVLIEDLKYWIKKVNASGGINYVSWHANNPETGRDSWDYGDGAVVCRILTKGTQANKNFNLYLDCIANFFLSLRDDKGQLIPVLFRPFHEANLRKCFWWSDFDNKTCFSNSFKDLWIYVENYLSHVKKVNNLLYVYTINDNCLGYHKTTESFVVESQYPGDNYVDVVGFDLYMKNEFLKTQSFESLIKHANSHNDYINRFAISHSKVSAITEAGWENYPALEKPFTKILYDAFSNYNYSFILFWRNPDRIKDFTSYYFVYPDHPNAKDFRQFAQTSEKYIFLKKLQKLRF
jgi:mannan endo-1,4-beta-mannosidase